jgi:uncharacterized protein YbjQ (UPF0145 family)
VTTTASPTVWASSCNGADLLALQSVGFKPAGVAMAMSAYVVSVYVANSTTSGPTRHRYPCPHRGAPHAPGLNWEAVGQQSAARTAFTEVAMKLARDVAERGAHGVIGVEVHRTALSHGVPHRWQLTMTGTAIRAVGAAAPTHPFATTLPAGQFIELLLTGRVPTGVVAGFGSVGMLPGCLSRMPYTGTGPADLRQRGDAIDLARSLAVREMTASAAKLGSDEIVAVELTATEPVHLPLPVVGTHGVATAIRTFESGVTHVGATQIFQLRDDRRADRGAGR